jgi:hypothetical protein
MAADDHRDPPGSAGAAGRGVPATDVPAPHKLLGVLADTAKLRVFAALVLASPEGVPVAQAAGTAGVGAAEAERALVTLTAVGLARSTPAGYAAAPGVLRESLSELGRRRAERAAKEFATDDPARLAVLLNCFQEGRLGYLPEKFEKRQIVLEELAQRFEPGVRYAEAEVNTVLRELYPDYAALRRYLVDAALLTRAEGYYWRSGGTVPV